MSTTTECVLTGAPLGPVPECSLAEYLVPKMRSLPKEHIIQVDADTGDVQTVSELLETSIRLSEGLKELGLKENDVVGLLSRNCFQASAVVLASWLSGAAVSPVPVNMKAAELKHVLGVAPPKFIFCEEEAVSTVTSTVNILSTPATIILVDSTEDRSRPNMTFQDALVEVEIDSYRPQPVTSPATQLVAILFSSGTSGLPKGVGITHRNLIFQDLNMENLFDIDDIKTCLQISCFFWVTGMLMFLRSLTTGISRVLLRETSIPNILQAIERYQTDWTLMGPSLVLSLVDGPEFDSFDLSSMKKIFIGGSPLLPAMINRITTKWRTVQIIPVYGTTENTGTISSNSNGKDLTSVGTISPGVEVKVIDRNTGAPLKSGSMGEICVKSLGNMKGYVANEEATKKAIDPEGWFHTGDLGYYDESGQIFIVDRIKEMLKIMNFQVAPAEVESCIMEIPDVAEAAVTGVTTSGDLTQLMALVVKFKNSTLTKEDIQAHVAAALSDYKQLTAGVHFVESIPKTKNGKLGRMEIKNLAQTLYSGSSC